MVNYPEEIQTGRKNLITVTYEADEALKSVLTNGVVFDLQLDMIKTVIQPQKRMLIPVESGRKTFSGKLNRLPPAWLTPRSHWHSAIPALAGIMPSRRNK